MSDDLKKYDFSGLDEVEEMSNMNSTPEYDFSGLDEPKMGKLEAAAIGAGTGVLPDFINNAIAGVGGMVGRGASKVAETTSDIASSLLGSEEEKKQRQSLEENLKKLNLPEEEIDLGYKSGVETLKKAQEKASEDQPWAYYGAMVPTSLATGSAATSLSKFDKLQKLQKLIKPLEVAKDASFGVKVGAAGLEAAKLSGLSALTGGENLDDIENAITGGVLTGAGLETALSGIKGGASVAGKLGKWGSEKVKDLPIIESFSKARNLALEGKNVTGKAVENRIIEESKRLVKESLQPLLKGERKTGSASIGKIIKNIDKVQDYEDFDKFVNKNLKRLENVRTPTEESKKTIDELKNLFESYKQLKTTATIKPIKGDVVTEPIMRTKVIRGAAKYASPEEEAAAKLQKQANKIIGKGEELGKDVTQFPPTQRPELGVQTSLLETATPKTTSFQSIAQEVPYGQKTPISYMKEQVGEKELYTKIPKYGKDITESVEIPKTASARDLQELKKGIQEIEGAAVGQKGLAPKAALTTRKETEDFLKSGMSESTRNMYEKANQKIKTVEGISEVLGVDLIRSFGPEGEVAINKAAQILRRAEGEGLTAENIRDKLGIVFKELGKLNPQKAQLLQNKANDIAERYRLNKLASTTFGLNLGTAQATAVRTGEALGKLQKVVSDPVRKLGKKLTNNLPMDKIQSLRDVATKSPKYQTYANALDKLLKTEDISKRNVMLYGLYQQPAFREFAKNNSQLLDLDDEE